MSFIHNIARAVGILKSVINHYFTIAKVVNYM